MSRLLTRFTALAVGITLGGALLAADEKAAPVQLARLTDVANGTGGAVSPDGKLLAVSLIEKYERRQANGVASARYHRVRLLDAATGKELAVIPGASAPHFSSSGEVLCVQQTFDEQFIKAGSLFGALAILPMPQLWNVANPQKPRQLFVVDSAMTESIVPDGRLLLVAGGPEQKFGNAGKVVTGLPRTGNRPGGAPGAGAGGLGGIGGAGGLGFGNGISLRFFELWDVASARFVARYEPLPRGKAGVANPVFSPDGKLVAAAVSTPQGKDMTWKIALYDVAAKKEARLIDLGGSKVVQYGGLFEEPRPMPLQFVPSFRTSADESSHLLAALLDTADGVELNLYDPANGKRITTLHQEKRKADGSLNLEFCVAPDGKTLAVVVKHFVNVAGGGRPNPGVPAGGGFAGGAGGAGFGGGGAGAFGNAGGGAGAFGIGGGAGGGFGGVGGGAVGGGAGGGRWFLPPAAGAVVLYDLEKRARTQTLNILPHTARFANERTLATLDFADKALNLTLWDAASAQEIGRLASCDQVHFARDGATVLTRVTEGGGASIKAWRVAAKRP